MVGGGQDSTAMAGVLFYEADTTSECIFVYLSLPFEWDDGSLNGNV